MKTANLRDLVTQKWHHQGVACNKPFSSTKTTENAVSQTNGTPENTHSLASLCDLFKMVK